MRSTRAGTGGAFSGPVRHVYVHVPFCSAKCDYCDFASSAMGPMGRVVRYGRAAAGASRCLRAYVDGVAAEWERERGAYGVRRVHTLYLGGGTPSLLGPDLLERLLEPFRPYLTPAAEVTVEVNPEDVDCRFAEWAADWSHRSARREGGASRGLRVSLGVQSFAAERRRALGRRSQADPVGAVACLRAAGVANLSLDMMYGLPGQTSADLEADIAAVLAQRPEHISWYELMVVAGTPLARRLAGDGSASRATRSETSTSLVATPDGEARAAMYRRLVRALGRAGYDWYEVSNYALPGRRARHNVAYWRARPYLGLGPGAVSTVGRRRWTNTTDVSAWQAALAAGAPPARASERLDARSAARERLMLAARCGLAVPLVELGDAVDDGAVATLAGGGLVKVRDGTIRVTRKGRYVADEVCVRLFRA